MELFVLLARAYVCIYVCVSFMYVFRANVCIFVINGERSLFITPSSSSSKHIKQPIGSTVSYKKCFFFLYFLFNDYHRHIDQKIAQVRSKVVSTLRNVRIESGSRKNSVYLFFFFFYICCWFVRLHIIFVIFHSSSIFNRTQLDLSDRRSRHLFFPRTRHVSFPARAIYLKILSYGTKLSLLTYTFYFAKSTHYFFSSLFFDLLSWIWIPFSFF